MSRAENPVDSIETSQTHLHTHKHPTDFMPFLLLFRLLSLNHLFQFYSFTNFYFDTMC